MQRNHENARQQNAQLQPVVQGDLEAIKNMPEELLNVRVMVDPDAQEKGEQSEEPKQEEEEEEEEDGEGKGEGNPKKTTKKKQKKKKRLFSATPLLVALGRGRIDSLQELLKRGQDPNEAGLGYGGGSECWSREGRGEVWCHEHTGRAARGGRVSLLCSSLLFSSLLFSALLRYAMLCYAMLCCAVVCCAVLCHALMLCSTLL